MANKKKLLVDSITDVEGKEFELELTRILKRAERIKNLLAGDATITRFWRKAHDVRAHKVGGHYVVRIGAKK